MLFRLSGLSGLYALEIQAEQGAVFGGFDLKKRILLSVAYDGTGYSGFQAQKTGVPTIEGELNRALTDLTREDVEVDGASRTDAGVHARCNLAVFDTQSPIPPEKFARAINVRLPAQIRVKESMEVPEDFHPRRCSTVKTYEYRIYNARIPDPMRRLYTCHSGYRFDIKAMQEAGAFLVGEHDFRSFCSVGTSAMTTVREILSVRVDEETESRMPGDIEAVPREIVIRVSGRGFLYNMVRIIAGTLMEVGRGALSSEEIPRILTACDRSAAGPTAPACGLTLVRYEIVEPGMERVFC